MIESLCLFGLTFLATTVMLGYYGGYLRVRYHYDGVPPALVVWIGASVAALFVARASVTLGLVATGVASAGLFDYVFSLSVGLGAKHAHRELPSPVVEVTMSLHRCAMLLESMRMLTEHGPLSDAEEARFVKRLDEEYGKLSPAEAEKLAVMIHVMQLRHKLTSRAVRS